MINSEEGKMQKITFQSVTEIYYVKIKITYSKLLIICANDCKKTHE
jgi:hypothetical protein